MYTISIFYIKICSFSSWCPPVFERITIPGEREKKKPSVAASQLLLCFESLFTFTKTYQSAKCCKGEKKACQSIHFSLFSMPNTSQWLTDFCKHFLDQSVLFCKSKCATGKKWFLKIYLRSSDVCYSLLTHTLQEALHTFGVFRGIVAKHSKRNKWHVLNCWVWILHPSIRPLATLLSLWGLRGSWSTSKLTLSRSYTLAGSLHYHRADV